MGVEVGQKYLVSRSQDKMILWEIEHDQLYGELLKSQIKRELDVSTSIIHTGHRRV